MPAQQPDHVDITFYAVIEPVWDQYRYDKDSQPILRGAKLAKTTVKPPSAAGGTIVTKVTMRVPASAMLPLQEAIVVEVHPSNTTQVRTVVTDPGPIADESGHVHE